MRNIRTVRVCTDRPGMAVPRMAPTAPVQQARAALLRADPVPPTTEAEGMDEEDRPHPTDGVDNLKISDDAPATPSESDPALPTPSKVTAGDREDELVDELGHETEREGGVDTPATQADVDNQGILSSLYEGPLEVGDKEFGE